MLHLIGAVLAAASAPLLLDAAGSDALRVAVVVYLVGLVAMLATSGIYHVPDWSPRMVAILRRADHSTIFLAVAGTYTPLLVAALDGAWRDGLLWLIWGGAVAGIVVRNVFPHAPRWLRVTPYVALGWVAVGLLPAYWWLDPLVAVLVIAGGVVYTLGGAVYARQRPDPLPRTYGYHEVFHTLVLLAAGLHWWAVWVAVTAG